MTYKRVIFLVYLGKLTLTTHAIKRRRKRQKNRPLPRNVRWTWHPVSGSEDGRRGRKPRSANNFWKSEKAREQLPLKNLWKESSPSNIWIITQWGVCWTSDIQSCEVINQCVQEATKSGVICYDSSRKITKAALQIYWSFPLPCLICPQSHPWRVSSQTLSFPAQKFNLGLFISPCEYRNVYSFFYLLDHMRYSSESCLMILCPNSVISVVPGSVIIKWLLSSS